MSVTPLYGSTPAERNLSAGSRQVLARNQAVSNGVRWDSNIFVAPTSAWSGELYFQASVAGTLEVYYVPAQNVAGADNPDPFITPATRQSLLASSISITANTLSVNRWQINLPPRFFISFTPSANGVITIAEVNAPGR